jgi:hypothetical protein
VRTIIKNVIGPDPKNPDAWIVVARREELNEKLREARNILTTEIATNRKFGRYVA